MAPRLILQFLGLPQVFLDDRPIFTDRRKAMALLAYLAVNDIGRSPQRYSRESLSALLWPDYDQAKAFSNLRTTIWGLRQAIGENWFSADHESVSLTEGAEIDLDVARFLGLLSESHQQDNPSLRIRLLSDAAKLYRDHFLTGFSVKAASNFSEWAFAESEDLRRKLADALTMLSEDHCALGQADQAIPYMRRLVTLDPLNESSHRQLMEVYWQAGQHSAALKQYQTCEQILRKELNLDPQPETRALYKKILKGEVKPVRVEKQLETTAPKNNLPLQLSSFIGREKEQDEIVNLVRKNRLVTLVGVGGIGKTRLSIQAASSLLHDFPNGAWLIELARLADPALVPQAIVNTLGLLEQAGRSDLNILTDFLQSKRALLLLDNCEHLIQTCAQLAETLLRTCPDLHILATSREALNIAGEAVYLVPALTTPDPLKSTLDTLPEYEAVQLFLERAQSAVRDFSLSQDNAHAIAQICHRLDGIPLALELAAARVRGLSVEQITSHLDDRFHLLTGGARTVLPRHQTLQAMIDWSHDLLTEPERVLLRRLAIFAGGWALEAAEAVCAGDGLESDQILDILLRLVDKSLVVAETQGTETRYHMLETIRQYAFVKLWFTGEGELLRQRHLAYFVDLAERAEPNLRAFDMVMWLDRLEVELDNIRIALEYALESNIEAQLRLASALLWFWHIRGHKNEGIDWLERGLSIEAAERGNQPLVPSRAMIRGKALNVSGFWFALAFEIGEATPRLEESLALFQELGPTGKQGTAYALLRLGSLSVHQVSGRSTLEQSLALFREMGDKFGIAECLLQLIGIVVNDDNDYKQALILAEEQLALRRELGDQDGIAATLTLLADLAFFSQDDYQKAIVLYEESLAIFRAVGNKWVIASTLAGYGDICLWNGNYDQATKIFEEALAFVQEFGERSRIAFYYYNLGFIAWFRGNYDYATQLITDNLSFFRDLGHHWLVVSGLHALGDIALAQGDEARAIQWYESELSFSEKIDLNMSLAFALCGLGKIALVQSNYELATIRFEQALTISREMSFKQGTFHALYSLGRIAQLQNDHAAARAYYVEMLEMQRQRISPLFKWSWLKTYVAAVSYPLEGFAVLAAAQNKLERGARLFSAAETLYTPLHFQMSAGERAEHDQAIAAARAVLGEEAFTAAWEEGKKMTLDQAIAYALKEE